MIRSAITLSALLLVPASGLGLGIRLFDHDAFATARGDAFVATADNPSAIYYNPAGITQLRGHNVRGAVNVLDAGASFEGLTRDVDTETAFIPVPGLYYTYSCENLPLSFGAGYYMPFGLALKWPDNGPFRGVTTHGELQDHTFSGVVAWRITDTLSIAAGPAVSYAVADLQRGILVPGDQFRFQGSDLAVGARAGLLWQPFKKHSFGINYRSPVTLDLEGEGTVEGFPVPKQDAYVELPLPQVIVVGYSYRPTPKWNLEVNLDWTDWDVMNTLVLKQESTPEERLPFNWKNSFAVEAGVTRYFENGMRLSAGYVYLQNSVPDEDYNPIVPDQDMHVFSVGIGGDLDRWSWDFTYQFTHGIGREVTDSSYEGGPGKQVNGDYLFIAHAFSLSLGYRF